MPSARERRRANPVLVSAGFRNCADFEIVRRFRILRDLVRPNPPTQLDIVRDFDEKLKLETANRGEVCPGRAVSAPSSDVSSLVAARAARLLPGRRRPGRDAIRAGTAARQPSACICRVSILRRFRDFEISTNSYSWGQLTAGRSFRAAPFRRHRQMSRRWSLPGRPVSRRVE